MKKHYNAFVALMLCAALLLGLCPAYAGSADAELVALCDENGEPVYADYAEMPLYVSLTAKIPYALYGYDLTAYYTWYPEYFVKDGVDYFAELTEMCTVNGWCLIEDVSSNNVSALECLQLLSMGWYGDAGYWYEFVCVANTAAEAQPEVFMPELTALCDENGMPVYADYSEIPLYASLTATVPYALYGYSLDDYYGWYPDYFSKDGVNYYAELSEMCAANGYCLIEAVSSNGVSALDCLKVLSVGWYNDDSYWYEFVFVAANAEEPEAAVYMPELIALCDANGEAIADMSACTLYVSVSEKIPYALYDYTLESYYGWYPTYYQSGDIDCMKVLEALCGEAGWCLLDSADENGVSALDCLRILSVNWYGDEQYWYEFAFVDSRELGKTEPSEEEAADAVRYVNLADNAGNLTTMEYSMSDVMFSPSAKLEYACYGYTLEDYYRWYAPANGYNYFVNAAGEDIWQKILAYMDGAEMVPVTEELTVLLRELAGSYFEGGREDYYYTFLIIPESFKTEVVSGEYTYNYVAEQYVETAPDGDPRVEGYTEDNALELYNEYKLAVSLTDPLTYLSGYSLSEYYGWYSPESGAQYFVAADGSDIYKTLEAAMDGARFCEINADIQAALESLSLNWYGDSKYWYIFTFIDTGYIELFDEDGYRNINLPLVEELYINLNQPLQYVMLDTDELFVTGQQTPVSLAQAYTSGEWADMFTGADGSDLYMILCGMMGETDEFGFAHVTNEMLPILSRLSYNRWKAFGDYSDYGAAFCFYRALDDADAYNPYADDEKIGEMRLVYPAAPTCLKDEDAYVITLVADGFTFGEEEKFFASAAMLADYIMSTSPFDEMQYAVKIYALFAASNESGVTNADVIDFSDVGSPEFRVDTYFGSHYWTNGTQRLVCLDFDGRCKLASVIHFMAPATDVSGLIVNSEVYGGSGGNYIATSLDYEANEIFVHEFGHSCAGLADEYYSGPQFEYEAANMTEESDPEKVKWAEYIGIGGCGVYPHSDNAGNLTGWYRPSETCKMRYLGENYPFCPVCKNALKLAIAAGINDTHTWDEGVIIAEPTADTIGKVLYTCTECGMTGVGDIARTAE